MKNFVLKTSIIKRLRIIMVTIAAFSIVVLFGIYFSSRNLIHGLNDINNANTILSLTTQSIEGIETTEENLNKLLESKKISDIHFSFNEAQMIINNSIKHATDLSQDIRPTYKLLMMAQKSLITYERSVRVLFSKVTAMPELKSSKDLENIKAELLVVQQFKMEVKDNLRKAQITLKDVTDSIFSSIYEKRFNPLIVATFLSIVFFAFIVTFGFAITRKLGRSIINLTRATEVASKGDLSCSAEISAPDEIGNLANAFNEMILSIKDEKTQRTLALERISRLQEITAAFSEALTVDQVCEVTVKVGFDALGANSGTIAITGENNVLEIRRNNGIAESVTAKWSHFSLEDQLPLSETLRYSLPIFIEGQEEILRRYPTLKKAVLKHNLHAWAFVPLEVATSKIGALGFYFLLPKKFTQGERDFMIAIGQQCAQAIHRSELYDEARVAIQARDEFLSIASHELKTPLTPLKLQFQMLSRQVQKGEAVSSEHLIKIVEASDKHIRRLTRLIEDLLDVSRISSGRLTLNFEKLNLADMIQEVILQYSHVLKESLKKVEITGSKNVMCECDRVRMEQVLINLLTNAVKYAPGKPITIDLQQIDESARISVTDQGPGLEEKDLSRIFERFERVKGKENVGGLGLGLYISKQIVKAHHGEIWVESEVGKGSSFIMEIPLVHVKDSTDVNPGLIRKTPVEKRLEH